MKQKRIRLNEKYLNGTIERATADTARTVISVMARSKRHEPADSKQRAKQLWQVVPKWWLERDFCFVKFLRLEPWHDFQYNFLL